MTVNRRASAADTGRWFRRFGANSGARRRLICFHHAGGSPSLFADWHRHITLTTEVWAVVLPGRETRFAEAPLDRMDELAAMLVEVMPLDLPFAFFGHSLGAVIGFEVASQLRSRGLPEPARLFVSACLAPQLCLKERSRATLSDAELLRALEGFGGTPKELLEYPEYLDMVLAVLRADFNVIDTYAAPENSELRFPITAYAGLSDPHIPPELMKEWERWSTPGFTCHSFVGDHFYLNTQRSALIGHVLARWNDCVMPGMG
ncbi:thioesterase domain-containing protein [Dyella sp. 2HG41-7]|uniref:thioesterase II family protein n=1 Tax=Dyella sp. 2HG41-7 TaxID=2883239 RepID=UPI001F2BA98D